MVQEAGDESWWADPVPANLVRYPTLAELKEAAPPAALLITFRQVPEAVLEAVPRAVIYHPPCLAVDVILQELPASNQSPAYLWSALGSPEMVRQQT